MGRAGIASGVLCIGLACSAGARADEPRPLHFRTGSASVMLSTMLSTHVAMELGYPRPARCGVCGPTLLDARVADWLGSADDPETFADVSDVMLWSGVGLGGALAFLDQGVSSVAFEDLALVLQSTLITNVITGMTKRAVARVRPGIYMDHPHMRMRSGQAYLSFFSGHASVSASVAASVATIAYLRDYSFRHVALVVGLGYALTTGSLRIAAHRHWLTDVLIGWAVGAAVGILVPLAYGREDNAGRPAASNSMPLFSGSF